MFAVYRYFMGFPLRSVRCVNLSRRLLSLLSVVSARPQSYTTIFDLCLHRCFTSHFLWNIFAIVWFPPHPCTSGDFYTRPTSVGLRQIKKNSHSLETQTSPLRGRQMSWQGDQRTHLFIPIDASRLFLFGWMRRATLIWSLRRMRKKWTVTDNYVHRRGCV